MKLLKNYSPKQKIRYLIGLFMLFILMSYRFSIFPTIEAYQEYKKQKNEVQQAATAPAQIRQYKELLITMENRFSQTTYDRAILFEMLNTFCGQHQLKLNHFMPEQRHQHHQYELITNPIVVQGNYIDMVNLAYYLEYVKAIGHIASSNFQIIKDRKHRKTYLEGTFYLQNVVQK